MVRQSIRWQWCLAAAISCLFAFLILHFLLRELRHTTVLDFISYWAAGKLALAGTPAAAFDLDALRSVQATVVGEVDAIMPFPYPPPFLLMVTPFAALPYFPAFIVWVVATGSLYLWSARRFADPVYAAIQPAVLVNGMIGQNGFLTAGIFMAGTSRLLERPFLAGAILGTLVIKPQLALLLPVAVIASRSWAAIFGALLSGGGLLLAAGLAFGWESYGAFLRLLPQYATWMAEDRFSWNEFASPFAFFRFLGVSQGLAMAIQLAALAGAALLCWIAWRNRWEERIVVLCAGTMLASPYLQAYDTLLMFVPIAWWLATRPGLSALLWLLCFLPMAGHMNLWSGPDTTPVAAMLSLGLLWWERQRGQSPARLAVA